MEYELFPNIAISSLVCYIKNMFKPIKGYEGLYEVSNFGLVYSLNYHREHRKQVMRGNLDKDGYVKIGLRKSGKRKFFRRSRLVAQAFISNPKKLPQVNHKNGHRFDDNINNLEWVTGSENIKHAFHILGKNQKGEKNNNSKITQEQAEKIWKAKGKLK